MARCELSWNINYSRKLIFFLSLLLLTNCTSPSSNSTFYFSGDINNLLIQQNELPPNWVLKDTNVSPLRGGEGQTYIYIPKNSLNESIFSGVRDREIISSITVFDQEKDAIEFWEYFYEFEKDAPNKEPCSTSQGQYIPEERFKYESDLADQFKIICSYYAGDIVGLFAYEYYVLARYGNVVSTFRGIIVNEEDLTMSEATERAVLRWPEMETLLKLIDEKFRRASRQLEKIAYY